MPPEGAARYELPGRQLFVPYTLLLVKAGGKLVLCDVGAGDLGNPGDQAFPGLDHRTSRTNLLVPSLLAAGIDPGEIDTVLITHAHPDHVGGMLDGAGRLVFPSAHYYVTQEEWEYWMSADPSAAGAEYPPRTDAWPHPWACEHGKRACRRQGAMLSLRLCA